MHQTDQQNIRREKAKARAKENFKSKQSTVDIPQGCVAKTADGKPLCFAFNKEFVAIKDRDPVAKGDVTCVTHNAKPYHECSHTQE